VGILIVSKVVRIKKGWVGLGVGVGLYRDIGVFTGW
jgi:hypothetical protein